MPQPQRQKLKPFSIWQGIPSRHKKVDYTGGGGGQAGVESYFIIFPPIWMQVGQNTHAVMLFTSRAGLDICAQLWAPAARTRPSGALLLSCLITSPISLPRTWLTPPLNTRPLSIIWLLWLKFWLTQKKEDRYERHPWSGLTTQPQAARFCSAIPNTHPGKMGFQEGKIGTTNKGSYSRPQTPGSTISRWQHFSCNSLLIPATTRTGLLTRERLKKKKKLMHIIFSFRLWYTFSVCIKD